MQYGEYRQLTDQDKKLVVKLVRRNIFLSIIIGIIGTYILHSEAQELMNLAVDSAWNLMLDIPALNK